MITVSKKKFDKSVDRNHIKRLVREAYRKNKIPLYEFLHTNKFQLAIGFIYSSKKITTFNHIENKIKVALSELIDKISDNNIKSV